MKLSVLVLNALFYGALFFAGCDRHESAALSPSAPNASGASITADPNPVSAGPGRGKTTITWNIAGDTDGAVYVKTDGTEEKLFAHGSKGTADAPWIVTGHTYDFRLYRRNDRTTPLAHVAVTRSKG